MAILYALVARGSVVLAEFSATSTTANAIARQILEKIPGTMTRMLPTRRIATFSTSNAPMDSPSFVWPTTPPEIFQFGGGHLSARTEVYTTVIYCPSSLFMRRIPFAFLEEIHQRFVRTYGRAVLSAQAYAMNDEFSRVLSQQMEYFSNDPNADRINRLRAPCFTASIYVLYWIEELIKVRNVMIENIDKVLERGDRLELLVDKTANMQGNTFRFRKQARRFRNTVWWRNVKLT
ncbi:UNVERIFIED_CONTAM: Vesicle-associated membrane protein [Sesamum radiatum]|uniref:Vesicle-associated membrane protein n=1 Tax=Sesamum radiatum TaxID=300843 RepID=A0AAW2KXQ8_SESRA